ncbi:hypothetical protein HUJ04_004438 [Dendroctonus ponderosae]
MTEEHIIRRKLLLDGNGTGDDKKLQNFLKQVTNWINANSPDAQSNHTFDSLLSQLRAFECNRKKSDLILQSNAAQMAKYRALHGAVEDKVSEISADLNKQESLLKQAKIFKQNQIDYALIARTVNQQPCRRQMKENIDLLKAEFADLVKEKERLDMQWNLRIKQCYVLSTSANELKEILKPYSANSDDFETMVAEEESL